MHPNASDLTGLRIGRLTVVRQDGITKDNHIAWLCSCECGNTKIIASNSLRRRRPVLSCGCMNATTAQAKVRADGAWNEGKSYVISGGEHCYKTRHGWAKAAIKHYGNRCQRCGWAEGRCDVHHREPKATGGKHTLTNALVICPNCHRVEHERGGRD